MPASYFSGSAALVGTTARRMVISQSEIIDSTIDMNLHQIRSVGDPKLSQDAANKNYVDSRYEQISTELQNFSSGYEVTLTAVDFVEVAYLRAGSHVVTVSGLEDGAPTGI